MQGGACEITHLGRAGADSADVVAAVTGDDEDNLVISLRQTGVRRAAGRDARVNNPKNEWMFNDMWGVDVAVSTPHLLTGLVQEAVTVGSFVRLLSFEGGKRSLEATLAGSVARSARRSWSFACRATPSSPSSATTTSSCRAATRSCAGDEVLVLVTPDSESEVREILTGRPVAHSGSNV